MLGGSFNPAHQAHLHISRQALTRLGLDEIWWLVSPGNPLKTKDGMASFADRHAAARAVATDRRIRVSDIETQLGSVYTVDILRHLIGRHRDTAFVWLMGADNLAQFEHWRDWQKIFQIVRIAIFDRPDYSFNALSCKAARRFAAYRIPESQARRLTSLAPPRWVFVHARRLALSATGLRAAGQWPPV